MADILTQLQTNLDQLLAQFYASLRYLNQHHAASAVPPPPNSSNGNSSGTAQRPSSPPTNHTTYDITTTTTTTTTAQQQQPRTSLPIPALTAQSPPPPPSADDPATSAPDPSLPPDQRPDPPAIFTAAQRELAQDLIRKHAQIQTLIRALPGLESSEEMQETRLAALDVELRGVLAERKEWESKRREVLGLVEGVILGVRR